MAHLTEKATQSPQSIYRFIEQRYQDMCAEGFDAIKFTLGDPTVPVDPHLSDAGILHYLEGRGTGDGLFSREQIKQVAEILEITPEKLAGKADIYTSFQGDVGVREKLAEAFNARHGTEFGKENFALTVGAEGAMNIALEVLADPIIVQEPSYIIYHNMLSNYGKQVMTFDTTEDGFAVKGGEGEKLDKVLEEAYQKFAAVTARDDFTFTLLLTDPGNPTGYKHSREELEAIRDLLNDKWKSGQVIADSIYFELAHDEQRALTLLDVAKGTPLEQNVIMVDSISKIDSAASSRGGMMVCADARVPEAAARKQIMTVSHPAFVSQKETLAAIEHRGEYVRRNAEVYAGKMQVMMDALHESKLVNYTPNGGYYAIMDLEFMKDVALSDATKKAAEGFYGKEAAAVKFQVSEGKVGCDSFLASMELAQRTGVFSVPVLSPNMDSIHIFSEDQSKEKPLLTRIVPTLAVERLLTAADRLSDFKQAVEAGAELPKHPPRTAPEMIIAGQTGGKSSPGVGG